MKEPREEMAVSGGIRFASPLDDQMLFNHEQDKLMKLPWVGESFARLAAAEVTMKLAGGLRFESVPVLRSHREIDWLRYLMLC